MVDRASKTGPFLDRGEAYFPGSLSGYWMPYVTFCHLLSPFVPFCHLLSPGFENGKNGQKVTKAKRKPFLTTKLTAEVRHKMVSPNINFRLHELWSQITRNKSDFKELKTDSIRNRAEPSALNRTKPHRKMKFLRLPGCRAKRANSTRTTQNRLRDEIEMSKNGHARDLENRHRHRQSSVRTPSSGSRPKPRPAELGVL